MSNVCKCDYCDSYIEYDNSDIELAPGVPNAIYIICPVCGQMIIIGTMDYPQF